jgi:hypothetical protein
MAEGMITDFVTDEARLLNEILSELRAIREVVDRGARFLDNPVKSYREGMSRGRRTAD